MGYDFKMCVFKKKTLERLQKIYPKETITGLYNKSLYSWLYPDDYFIPKGEEGRTICDVSFNLFKNILHIENDYCVIVDKETYEKMYSFLENKLKKTTLFDLIDDEETTRQLHFLLDTFKDMRNANIDFENEVIICTNDW